MPTPTHHIPILLQPVVQTFNEVFHAHLQPAILIDCTLGGGGHTRGVLDQLNPQHRIIAVDQDPEAIERAHFYFKKEIQEKRLSLIHSRFSELTPERLAQETRGAPILGILADLGFSSDQLDQGERGLSFLKEGPLDMRLNPTEGESLKNFLHRATEDELYNIIKDFGEERFSKRIASFLVRKRNAGEFPQNTLELAHLISQAVPPPARRGRIHPATRTFQAFRIFINQELQELDLLLERVILNLAIGGRAAIISFHSLEDRRVKHFFRKSSGRELGAFQTLTKKPIEPSDLEIQSNSRARSAKLRIAERIR